MHDIIWNKTCLHIIGFATHVFPPECSEISLLQSFLHTHTHTHTPVNYWCPFLSSPNRSILISTGTWPCYDLYFVWLKVHWLNTEVMRLRKQREGRVRKKRNRTHSSTNVQLYLNIPVEQSYHLKILSANNNTCMKHT